MPEATRLKRQKLGLALGVTLVQTARGHGRTGAIARAEEILALDCNRRMLLRQFKKPANPAIHEETTEPEILRDTDGGTDLFVSGDRTGGAINGIFRNIRNDQSKPVFLIVVTLPNSGESDLGRDQFERVFNATGMGHDHGN